MPNPAITALILTCYPRRREMLETALVSFRAQTFADAEALIVNDGVPITCAAAGVRVLNLPRAPSITVGDKRNAGLGAARGEWIAIWDDDDVSLPGRLAESFAALDGGRVAYVKSSTMWVADGALRVATLCWGCCYPTALFQRAAALDVGGFPDQSYAEDAGLLERLGAAGRPWRDVQLRSYVHRRHRTNVSALVCGESLGAFMERAIARPPEEVASVDRAVQGFVLAARKQRLIRPAAALPARRP